MTYNNDNHFIEKVKIFKVNPVNNRVARRYLLKKRIKENVKNEEFYCKKLVIKDKIY